MLSSSRFWLLALVLIAVPAVPAFAQSAATHNAFQLEDSEAISRIVFGSCLHQDRPQPIWPAIQDAQPELFIWAGDNMYGDSEVVDTLVAKWDRQKQQPGYQPILEQARVLATWDDHDYGLNDGGASFSIREEAQQAMLDFLDVPTDDPRRTREGVYHAETYGPPGQRVQVILLDTRYHRSELERFPPPPGARRGGYRPLRDEDATFLGEAQWDWLEEQLLAPADLRLIVSSIQIVASEHRFEKWHNLPREQQRFYRLLETTRAEGVILLSGDRHQAELSRQLRPGAYPLYDLTSSGLNMSDPNSSWPLEPNRYRLGEVFRGHHFGTVMVDWEAPDPLIQLAIVDANGEEPITQDIRLSELKYPQAEMPRGTSNFNRLAMCSGTSATGHADLVVDGSTSDWTDTAAGAHCTLVDDEALYVRFTTGDTRTLRRHGESVIVAVDADGDADTGWQGDLERGIELTIQYAHPPSQEGRRWGPLVTAYASDGTPSLYLDDMPDVQTAPTHAASWFEARIPRSLAPDVENGGTKRVYVYGWDKQSGRRRALMQATVEVQPARAAAPPAVTIPTQTDATLRVMAMNTLWRRPDEQPAPFTRVFNALDADVYLIQEWRFERFAEHEITEWFATHIDSSVEWHAAVSDGLGVAVVSPHPIVARVPTHLPLDAGGWDFPIRMAGAVIDAPQGRVLAASVHYKASGGFGAPEDVRRLAEAEAVNRMLVGMSAAAQPDLVVLGGDYNMVGTPTLADHSVRGLDADGSALTLSTPTVLGAPTFTYTHVRQGPRNRLDYIAYGEAAADVQAAFVLDAARLPEATVNALGLERTDTAVSDHLPVVLDLVLKSKR
ncbi:MAG: alkaline phosphatase D family protein [Bacteroidota bacterium]